MDQPKDKIIWEYTQPTIPSTHAQHGEPIYSHYINVWRVSTYPKNWGGGEISQDQTLMFRINFLTSKSEYRSCLALSGFGFEIQQLRVEYLPDCKKVIDALAACEFRTMRSIIRAFRKAKVYREDLAKVDGKYREWSVPRKYRKNQDLFIQAAKRGLKLAA